MKNVMIEDFIFLSTVVGSRADYVQGGGGNTSCKVSPTDMLIKASGCLLKDMTQSNGHVVVNYDNIVRFLDSLPQNEDIVNQYINNQIISQAKQNESRPSIETGFHALIKHSFILHTHSVYANIINCSVEGKNILNQHFSDALFVPYFRPGLQLTLQLQKALKKHDYCILFLQNHGLIVAANNIKTILSLQEDITKKVKEILNLGAFPEPAIEAVNNKFFSRTMFVKENFKKYNINFIQKNILFPDQVVYFSEEKIGFDNSEAYYSTSLNEAYAIEQTLVAYFYILEALEKNRLTPSFLSELEAQEILNMESEKHRKKVIQS